MIVRAMIHRITATTRRVRVLVSSYQGCSVLGFMGV